MKQTELSAKLQADGEIVTERLDHWVSTAGDRTFLYYGEDDLTLTYAEFGELTDRVAGNLARHGIVKGERVSVFCTNPYLATVMMFAIWKAGAVYSPVNFSYTGRLLSYQLEDTAPTMVVTEPKLLPALNAVANDLTQMPGVVVYAPPATAHDHTHGREAVQERFGEIEWSSLLESAERPQVSVAFDDPANIVYTSGTTGPAKGVVQPHRWMAQYTYSLRLLLTSDDVVYNDLPMYHVGGAIANVVRAAWVGCEVALWNRFSPNEFWQRIATRRATTAILLDVMIPWLLKAPERANDRANTLNKVYMQPLPQHHAEVARRFGFDFVAAGFGQTEAGAPLGLYVEETAQGEGTPDELYVGHSHHRMTELAASAGLPILAGSEVADKGVMGLPTPFFEAAVLDEHDRECDSGEPGELAFRPQLPGMIMGEYLGKPEATVKAWRNLWFHTGDSALQDERGIFRFVDRLGDRIRVRGENLSSFQVEDIINQHPAVQYSAVFPIPGHEGDENDIVAFVVAEEGSDLNIEQLHAYAVETMPRYMRPRHVRLVADIPRTPTNKIEKYKLRKQILEELDR